MMGDQQQLLQEALKPSSKPGTDNALGPKPRGVAASSDSDGSASVDDEDLSGSGSDDCCGPVRKGGLRRTSYKSPLRKRRKRPEWTRNEEETLAQVHCGVGNQWSVIAARLPGRTANEVKNIWHSTLRSKHLKARSLLRAYATALNGRWDDEGARQEAYATALRQHAVNASEADASARPQEAGGLPGRSSSHGDTMETPRLGAVSAATGTDGMQGLTPAVANTPDSSRSPAAIFARDRGARGPPTTALRPLAQDGSSGRRGQHHHQHARASRASPRSCPAKAAQACGDQVEVRYGLGVTARYSIDSQTQRRLSGPAPAEGGPQSYGGTKLAGLPDDNARAPETAARPLPLTLVGFWANSLPLPQCSWPQQQLHNGEAPGFPQLQQPLRPQQGQLQGQPQLAPPHLQQQRMPRDENELPQANVAKVDPIEDAARAPPQLAHDQVLAYEPFDTWLGRVDPSLMLHEEDATAPEYLRCGGADSNSSSVVRTATAAGGLGEAPSAHHPALANPGACGDLVESGPASGAWSTNTGAAGFHLQSPPLDGCALHHPDAQAQAQDSSTPMAISPAAQGGDGGDLAIPSCHWHGGATTAGFYGGHDRAACVPYGVLAGAVHAAPPDFHPNTEGRGRPITPGSWTLSSPRHPHVSRTISHGHESWNGDLPTPQGLRPGLHAADVRGSMYMVPLHASPLPPFPPLPPPHVMYAAPPHSMQHCFGHQPFDHLGRQHRMRLQERMVYQQRQQQQQQFFLHLQQQQQQEQQQAQYSQQQQQPHAYQQVSQQQEQQQEPRKQYQYQLPREEVKQEPQNELQQQQQQQAETPQSQQQQEQRFHSSEAHLPLVPVQQQEVRPPPPQQAQQLEQQADSLSSSDVVTMGFESLQDPQLRWCLTDID